MHAPFRGTTRRILAVFLAAPSASLEAAPVGTAFTYQGQLKQDGVPAHGVFAMKFMLFDAAVSPPGVQIGVTISQNVTVVNGLFTVELNVNNEFGAAAFDGSQRFLEITVDGTVLAPRQKLTLTPYAETAVKALSVSGVDGHSLDAADGNPVDALFVDNTGQVGIGTTAPQDKLHVFKGDAGAFLSNANASVVIENDATTYLNFMTPSANEHGILFGLGDISAVSGGIIYNNSAVPQGLQLRTGGNSTRMTIDNTGQVGINTTAPAARLHVNDNTDVSASGGGSLIVGSTANSLRFDANEVQAFSGGAVGHLGMQVDGGNLGIGTLSPTAKLHVSGTALVTGTLSVTAPAGDASVALPTGSVSAAETLDEPGLASDYRENLVTLTGGAAFTVLASRSITVPTNGHVLAYATASIGAGIIVGQTSSALFIQKTTAPTADTNGFPLELGSLQDGTTTFHAIFAVTQGTHTFELRGVCFVNNCQISTRRLTLLFFPTTYGTTDVED